MIQTINQLLTIEQVKDLLQEIKHNANEVWLVEGRECITVRRGNRTVQIMVWVDDGNRQQLPEPTRALADRWG